MYYRSGTGGGCCIGAWKTLRITHQMAALFCLKWRHGRRFDITTSNQKSDSVNRCVFTVGTTQPNFLSRSDIKRRSLRLSEEVVPTRRTTRWVTLWNQFLV